MRGNRKKVLVVIALTILLLSIFQLISFATSSNIIIIKQTDTEYLIYIDDILDKEFEFAFSNTKDETDLNYIRSITDDDNNNIAYVDEELQNLFFYSEDTYLWIKTSEEIVISGEKITLNNAKTLNEFNNVETITKSITVVGDAEEEKIKINGTEGEVYYYQFSTITNSEQYTKLVELVNTISEFDENTNVYTKLQTYIELEELYSTLLESLEEESWVKTENLEITKPYDAKEGQQYILWLKDSDDNIDIQILTTYEEEVTVQTEETTVEQVETILPVTYDDTTILFIILGVVVFLIVVILILKKTGNVKKEDKN